VTERRAKTANLRRDPRASLYVGRSDFGAYCVVEGDVEITPVAADPDDPTVDALVDYFRSVVGEHDDWHDYRRAVLYLWSYVVVIAGGLDPDNTRGRAWLTQMVRRSATALLDLDCLELLDEFQAP